MAAGSAGTGGAGSGRLGSVVGLLDGMDFWCWDGEVEFSRETSGALDSGIRNSGCEWIAEGLFWADGLMGRWLAEIFGREILAPGKVVG